MNKQRNVAIDILKALGIILIILAHTCKSSIILQLRNFDVVLLVILSGYLALDSYKTNESFLKY